MTSAKIRTQAVAQHFDVPVSELAPLLEILDGELSVASVNLLAEELGVDVRWVRGTEPRNVIVSVVGHVDHGKTSLLAAIAAQPEKAAGEGEGGDAAAAPGRAAAKWQEAAAREDGGITQSLSSFTWGDLCFIDTPGHEAFEAMRGPAIRAADIVVVAVAAAA